MNKRSPLPLRNPSCRRENKQATASQHRHNGRIPQQISDILGVSRERSQERGHMNCSREDEKLAPSLHVYMCGWLMSVRVKERGYQW